jgi:hypothetical protein
MKHEETNHSVPVLDPVREIIIRDSENLEVKINVRELTWPKALKFCLMLADKAAQFAKEGRFDFKPENFPALIANASELSDFLILESTGRDHAWLEALPVSSAFAVLDAALAINLSPEVLGSAKKAAGRFAQAIGVDAAGLVKKPSPQAATS